MIKCISWVMGMVCYSFRIISFAFDFYWFNYVLWFNGSYWIFCKNINSTEEFVQLEKSRQSFCLNSNETKLLILFESFIRVTEITFHSKITAALWHGTELSGETTNCWKISLFFLYGFEFNFSQRIFICYCSLWPFTQNTIVIIMSTCSKQTAQCTS